MARTQTDIASAVQLINKIEQKSLTDTKAVILTAIDGLKAISEENGFPADYRSIARDIYTNVLAFLQMQIPGLDSHIVVPAPASPESVANTNG